MQIKITLSGSGGELDSQIVDVPAANDEAVINRLAHDVIDGWTLSAGDTITIETVR